MDYISREDALIAIHHLFPKPPTDPKLIDEWAIENSDYSMCIDAIEHLPAADVVERKKGKWVEVGGFATPGGDPVWCCSECLKGRHVWGIEHSTYGGDIADNQWVSCPNCGADMRE